VILGVGGSATNDAGFGLARGLGWRFRDAHGDEIVGWTQLTALRRLTLPEEPPPAAEFIVAVDVANPLLGLDGCTRVYGPQKGLRPGDLAAAEGALEQLQRVVAAQLRRDLAATPGAGAAGGLGYGLPVFLGARIESGFALFAEHAALDERIHAADLVLTGEGSLDRQSFMGKGTGQVAARCRALGRPCVGLAGVVEPVDAATAAASPFTAAHGIVPALAPAAEARADAARWLEALARQVAAGWPRA
jgi:glycerate 2-kinase